MAPVVMDDPLDNRTFPPVLELLAFPAVPLVEMESEAETADMLLVERLVPAVSNTFPATPDCPANPEPVVPSEEAEDSVVIGPTDKNEPALRVTCPPALEVPVPPAFPEATAQEPERVEISSVEIEPPA